MLIEFRTSNALSFKEMTELSMVASSDKTHDGENTYIFNKMKFLKSAVIYGANGSGKTNLVNAFSYMRSLIIGQKNLRDFSFKLDSACAKKPSYFEVVFFDTHKKRYRYGFESSKDSIVSEWLFQATSSRESMLFTREGQEFTLSRTNFAEGKALTANTKPDRLFISVVAELNGEIAQSIVNWFSGVSVRSGLVSSHHETLARIMSGDDAYKRRVLDILHSFDVQMEDVIIKERERVPLEVSESADFPASFKKVMKALQAYMDEEDFKPEPQVLTVRKIYKNGKDAGKVELDLLENESDGTKKLFELAGYIVDVLTAGGTMIIDELESKLHPLITKELVAIFNSKKMNNRDAQLIFTTHDTNLLKGSHFRRDQIWFTEKDKYGVSHLYSLAEYKEKPRKDSSFEKDYIRGRYGAIPFIGDFSELAK